MLSSLFFVLVLLSPTVFVPGLFRCDFLYLVTTAGFVADYELIMCDKQQKRVRFYVIVLFGFYLSSFCDIGESGMGSAPLFWGGQLTHRAMRLVSVYLIILFHLIASLFSCVFLVLCAAFVVLALVFLPGLYSTAYRAAPSCVVC